MSDNKKKPDTKATENKVVQEKAAEMIKAAETDAEKPVVAEKAAVAEDKEFKKKEIYNMGKKPAQMGLGVHSPNNDRYHSPQLMAYSSDNISVIL